MAKVRGADAFSDRLKRGKAKSASLVDKALYAGGQLIEIEAERSITEGSISGPGHIPSRPGEPPSANTRLLDTSIHTTKAGPGRVRVTSNAPYSAALEWGTSKMAARPFMRPATRKKKDELTALVGKAVSASFK